MNSTAKTKPRINVPLLREIQATIIAEPMQHHMHSWISKDERSPCGTTACIAGLACILDAAKKDSEPIGRIAAKLHMLTDPASVNHKASRLLGITHRQAGVLFYVNSWPEPFRGQYIRLEFAITSRVFAVSRRAAAKISVARIEHFITTNGKE